MMTRSPGLTLGVNCRYTHHTDARFLAQPFDVVVVPNGPASVCLQLRPFLAADTPLTFFPITPPPRIFFVVLSQPCPPLDSLQQRVRNGVIGGVPRPVRHCENRQETQRSSRARGSLANPGHSAASPRISMQDT